MPTDPTLYAGGSSKNSGATSTIEKEKMGEGQTKPNALVSRYWREIERYERSTKDWYQEGDEIINVYLDESRSKASASRKFALLWANVETLKPAVYAKIPRVLCSRRHSDRDPLARIACDLLERGTNTTFDLAKVDETFRMVRDDRLLPGRGQAWVRYEAEIETYEDEAGAELAGAEPGAEGAEPAVFERLKCEKVAIDHVAWKDFGHNVCNTWQDVWLVWRVVYKTRDEVADRFGEDKANSLSYTSKPPGQGSGEAKDDPDDRTAIYELWDKKRGTTSWIAKGAPDFLDSGAPPIKFHDFFPCPEPCYATKVSKEMIPRPDYRYYRDQAKEINDLTDKIGNLTQWLMVKGFVPSGPSGVADPIEEVLRDKGNSELFVQVDSWKEWTERGGGAKLVDWLPVGEVVAALKAAIEARNQLIQDVFQISGISDILRGQTDPNETLGAQQLKSQTGTRRLRNTKDEIARFTRDVAALVAEVIAEKFEPQSIADMTGYRYVPSHQVAPMLPGPVSSLGFLSNLLPAPSPMQGGAGPAMAQLTPMVPQTMPATPLIPQMMSGGIGHNGGPVIDAESELVFDDRVVGLLRNDRARNFRIDIETDSTIQADENAEKAARVEFVTSVGGYLEKVAGLMQHKGAAAMAPALGEIMMFLCRGYRAGRSLEEAIETGFSRLQRTLETQTDQPSPDLIKAQASAEAIKAKAVQDSERHKAEMVALQQKTVAETALMNKTLAMKDQDAQFAREEHARRMEELARQLTLKMQEESARSQAAQDALAMKQQDQAAEQARAELQHHLDVLVIAREQERQELAHSRDAARSAHESGAKAQSDEDRATLERAYVDHLQRSDQFLGEIKSLIAALTAPKKVSLERGPDGQLSGATTRIGL